MSKFIRLGYLIGAAAIHLVIMLNAGPAWAECQSGDQLAWDGRCYRNGRETGQDVVVCVNRCTARANNGTPITGGSDDEEENEPSILDPRVAQCALNCRTGRRQPW
jgi:hypothetical protein